MILLDDGKRPVTDGAWCSVARVALRLGQEHLEVKLIFYRPQIPIILRSYELDNFGGTAAILTYIYRIGI